LARLPVKEVTVFKDGHAYVIHEGKAPVEEDGQIRMDYLPTPILGTFWAYSSNPNSPARKVTAGVRRVLVEQTALTLPDLLAANPGADVVIQPKDRAEKPYAARIIGFPTQSAAEQEANAPPYSDPKLPERASLLLVSTETGVKTLALDRIESVTFKKPPREKLAHEEFRNVLTLSVPGAAKGTEAAIGLMYVQKGLRWIPSYRLVIDGKGKATVRMQATLINDLIDLKDARVNLVIGVPTFAFQNTPDPISLQAAFARLSPYFDSASRGGQVLSNAIMTQAGRMSERVAGGMGGGGSAPEVPDVMPEGKAEDLYVFKVTNMTLKKGERMVVPVTEFTIPYKDVYTLTIPYAPPPELRGNAGDEATAEMARLLRAPKVLHKLRLTNTADCPLTTAPALILSEGRVLAQGMMTYTTTGAVTDLELTTAVDISVKRTDTETSRTPNALTLAGLTYGRADSAGKITLTNHRNEPVEIEVKRFVLGQADKADSTGEAANVDPFADEEGIAGLAGPYGYRPYPWPDWWMRANGIGRFAWKVALEPGQTTELGYVWHYFWRQ